MLCNRIAEISGRDACVTMKHPRKILRALKAKRLGDLADAGMLLVEHSLGLVDLHFQKEMQNGLSRILFENSAQRADAEMKMAAK